MKRAPLTKSQFKAIEAEWYAKLKEEGFNDIEDTAGPDRLLKVWHSSYFQSRYAPVHFSSTETYYLRAGEFFSSYAFKTQSEKEMWGLHAEGKTVREIEALFKGRKGSFSRASINNSIRRLAKIMQEGWEVTHDQPNPYPRSKRRG